ncbi:MAG: rhomboid family intramembrane serine protease, partial [Verrucomicrobiota bacterium]
PAKPANAGFGYLEEGKPFEETTREELVAALGDPRKNISLIGVPGSEKLLPQQILWQFSDSDAKDQRKKLLPHLNKALFMAALFLGLYFYTKSFYMLIALMFFGLSPLMEVLGAWFQGPRTAEENRFRAIDGALFSRWMKNQPIGYLIGGVAVLIGIFLIQYFELSIIRSVIKAGLVKSRVADGEWWRLVTCGLLHGGWIHLLFNGMALFTLGRVLTSCLRPTTLAALFLFGVLGGSILSQLLTTSRSVGASGGLCGFLGFLTVMVVLFRKEVPGFLAAGVIRTNIMMVILGFLGMRFIDNAAHGGGFLVGAAFAFILFQGRKHWWEFKQGPMLRGVGLASVFVLLLAVVQILRQFYPKFF